MIAIDTFVDPWPVVSSWQTVASHKGFQNTHFSGSSDSSANRLRRYVISFSLSWISSLLFKRYE